MPALGMTALLGYRPSGRVGPLGVPLLLLWLVLLPVVGAVLYDKLGHLGGMLIFSAMGLGILLGFAMVPAIQFGKVRNKAIAGVLGAVIGATAFLGMMGLEAWDYRDQFKAYYTASFMKNQGLTLAESKALVEKICTPDAIIEVYWRQKAANGLLLTSNHGRTQSQLTGMTFWVVQGLEFTLVTLTVMGFGIFFAGRRFSEELDCWYKSKPLGFVAVGQFKEFLALAQESRWDLASRYIYGKNQEVRVGAKVNLYYLTQKPGGQVVVSAKVHKNKDMQPILEQVLKDEEMAALWPEFNLVRTI